MSAQSCASTRKDGRAKLKKHAQRWARKVARARAKEGAQKVGYGATLRRKSACAPIFARPSLRVLVQLCAPIFARAPPPLRAHLCACSYNFARPPLRVLAQLCAPIFAPSNIGGFFASNIASKQNVFFAQRRARKGGRAKEVAQRRPRKGSRAKQGAQRRARKGGRAKQGAQRRPRRGGRAKEAAQRRDLHGCIFCRGNSAAFLWLGATPHPLQRTNNTALLQR